MDEAGAGVVTHSSAFQVNGHPPQGAQALVRQPDIRSHALDVEAVLCDPAAVFPKPGIGHR
jgi:hypothetical protein